MNQRPFSPGADLNARTRKAHGTKEATRDEIQPVGAALKPGPVVIRDRRRLHKEVGLMPGPGGEMGFGWQGGGQ